MRFITVIDDIALHGKQAYIPGTPVEHTIFRNGCQQVAIDLHRFLAMTMKDMENN